MGVARTAGTATTFAVFLELELELAELLEATGAALAALTPDRLTWSVFLETTATAIRLRLEPDPPRLLDAVAGAAGAAGEAAAVEAVVAAALVDRVVAVADARRLLLRVFVRGALLASSATAAGMACCVGAEGRYRRNPFLVDSKSTFKATQRTTGKRTQKANE